MSGLDLGSWKIIKLRVNVTSYVDRTCVPQGQQHHAVDDRVDQHCPQNLRVHLKESSLVFFSGTVEEVKVLEGIGDV